MNKRYKPENCNREMTGFAKGMALPFNRCNLLPQNRLVVSKVEPLVIEFLFTLH